MSRLYYEKQESTSYRETGEVTGKNFDDYLNKVARLVPSEVIAGYLTMMGFTVSMKSPETRNIVIWIILLAGLVLTPVYLNKVADENKPKRNHILMSTIAFLVWATATTGTQIFQSLSIDFDPAFASIVLILFSLVSAVVPLDK